MDVIYDQDIWETLLCNYTPNSGCGYDCVMFVRKIENWLLVRQLWAKWEEGENAGKNAAAVGKGGDKVNNGEASRDEEKRPQTRTVIQCSNVTVGEVMEEFQATFSKVSNHVNSDGPNSGR